MQMGDSVFMFFSALLVWIMTPAIALFYGGMVRSKNMLSTAMYSVGSLAVISVLWIVAGYSLAFSTQTAKMTPSLLTATVGREDHVAFCEIFSFA